MGPAVVKLIDTEASLVLQQVKLFIWLDVSDRISRGNAVSTAIGPLISELEDGENKWKTATTI